MTKKAILLLSHMMHLQHKTLPQKAYLVTVCSVAEEFSAEKFIRIFKTLAENTKHETRGIRSPNKNH